MSTQPTALAEIIAYYNVYGKLPDSPQSAPTEYSYTLDPTQYVPPVIGPPQTVPVTWTGPASFQVPGAAAPQVPAPGTQPVTIVTPPPTAAPPAAPAATTTSGAAIPTAPGPAAPPAPVHVPALSAQFISGSTGTGIGSIGGAALSFIPIIGPILGALFGSLFGGTDLSQVTKQLNQLAQQLGQLGDTLTRLAWSIGFGLGELTRFNADSWDNFLDALWDHVKKNWKLLWCEVSQVIPKIIQIIRDHRKYQDWIYKHLIQPALKWIQRARVVIQILKALHVPFAAKLDKIIAQIQGALFLPFSTLLGWFNIHSLWINSILTWDWTIQRAVFQRTMYKYQGDWINMWWSTQFQPSAPTSGGAPVPLAKPCTVGECAQQVQAMVAVTPSAFPPEVEAAAAELQSWVQTGV